MNNQGKNRGRRQQVSNRTVRGALTRQELTGGRYQCPVDPPQYTLSPWNTLTLAAVDPAATVTGSVSVADLQTELRTIFGFTGGQIRIRMQRVRAWLPNNGSIGVSGKPYGISIVPYSFTTGAGITTLSDVNSRLNYAAVAYAWGLGDRTVTLFSGSTRILDWAIDETAGSAGKVLFYFDFLWQFNTFAAPETRQARLQTLVYPHQAADQIDGAAESVVNRTVEEETPCYQDDPMDGSSSSCSLCCRYA